MPSQDLAPASQLIGEVPFSVWNKWFDIEAIALSDIARCSTDSTEFQTHIAQSVLECFCGTLNGPRYYFDLIYLQKDV